LDIIEFKKYNLEETEGILKERIDYAFFPESWSKEAVELACQKTFELGDIRCGLLMLKKAGKTAEDEGAQKVEPCHVEKILSKVDKYSVKGSSDLDKETRDILHLIKENGGKTTFELFEMYQKNGGTQVYRTVYRKIKYLEMNKYVSVEKVFGGKNGNTSIVQYMK
jgi:cell division control protein 6